MPIQQNKGKKGRFLSGFCVTYDDRGGGGGWGVYGTCPLSSKKKVSVSKLIQRATKTQPQLTKTQPQLTRLKLYMM